jgi:fructose-1,6-bisphosphatase
VIIIKFADALSIKSEMKHYNITTLNDFIILKQKEFSYAKGELSSLLHHIGTAAKMVNKKINKEGLVNITGLSGEVNIQSENQQKLDVYADEVFINALLSSGECCGVATEENQNEIVFSEPFAPTGKLRLVYECNPIAFIAIQAGGSASDGKSNILKITPAAIHQRSPFYVGSKNMVKKTI